MVVFLKNKKWIPYQQAQFLCMRQSRDSDYLKDEMNV